ncbi:MAG: hypothetical protein ACPGQS_09210 [Bradymonadia bacterium]
MDARNWFRFFQWLEALPPCKTVIGSYDVGVEPEALPTSFQATLTTAFNFGFVVRFDWLSDSLNTLLTHSNAVRVSERDNQRNEILRAATRKRQIEAKKKRVLFKSKWDKWEKETELSRLERQSIKLADAHAEQEHAKRLIREKHIELIESLNKLPNSDRVKACAAGIYRLSSSGELIWHQLQKIGIQNCAGWSLDDILEIGYLLPNARTIK